MKLINQSAQYLPQGAGIDGIYKQIELAGRTSYLSWDKMTDASAKKFVDMLVKSKHTSVLEHGTVYLTCLFPKSDSTKEDLLYWEKPEVKLATDLFDKYKNNPYSKQICLCPVFSQAPYGHHNAINITTNLRVLQENNWLDDLQYLCEPTEFHEKRLSVKVVTDIGVTREFNRHRTFSIVEQSTRYCNFSKNKFGNEITFINPVWGIKLKPDAYGEDLSYNFFLNEVETLYKHLTNDCGWSAQQARTILPLCTKTEVVYTAFESDWRHFFDLRLFGKTGEPHPQMKQLAELIKQEFEKAGVWEGIMKYPSKCDWYGMQNMWFKKVQKNIVSFI